VVIVLLQRFVFDFYGIPFAMTVLISLALIFAYTYRGGLKTIIITDTLQTFSSYFGFLTIVFICNSLDFSAIEAFGRKQQLL
jgi:Na+/proline symporter